MPSVTSPLVGPFETERLHLRRFTAADAEGLHAFLSLPDAVRFEPYGVQSLSQCRALARERADNPDFWAVCLRGSGSEAGELAGNLALHQVEPADWRTFELGYVFHPGHWGKGYATEAASALVSACFEQGAHRVLAECNPQNAASWRLLERLGFRREGHLVGNASFQCDEQGNQVWQDTYLYGLLAAEWSHRGLRGD